MGMHSLFSVDLIQSYASTMLVAGDGALACRCDQDALSRLEIICQALKQNRDYTRAGSKFLFRQLAENLVNYCEINAAFDAIPQLSQERVSAPLIIAGMPRSGTSLLQNLMSLDEQNRNLTLAQSLRPANKLDDHQKWLAEQQQYAWIWSNTMHQLMPDMAVKVRMDVDSPVECSFLKRNSLVCDSLNYFSPLAQMWQYWREVDKVDERYRSMLRQLQILQWRQPGGRWLLKSPSHFSSVSLLQKHFPDACVIKTVRNMEDCLPSYISLILSVRRAVFKNVDAISLARETMQTLKFSMNTGISAHKCDNKQIFTIDYDSLSHDPIASVQAIYDYFGLDYYLSFERQMSRWLKNNVKHQNGEHYYSLSQFGISRKKVEELFSIAV